MVAGSSSEIKENSTEKQNQCTCLGFFKLSLGHLNVSFRMYHLSYGF